MVLDSLLVYFDSKQSSKQLKISESTLYYKALQQEKRDKWLISYSRRIESCTKHAMIVLCTGLLGALSQYEVPRPTSYTRSQQSGLESHLEANDMRIGSYAIGIDPDMQEERIYQVQLKEIARTRVSTAKIVGAKQRGGDGRTPENDLSEFFEIQQTLYSGHWIDPFDKKIGSYGPYFARIDTPDNKIAQLSGGRSPIGLHGTNEYGKLGFRASHGCIRHANSDIALYKQEGYLKAGTPVVIRSGLFRQKK